MNTGEDGRPIHEIWREYQETHQAQTDHLRAMGFNFLEIVRLHRRKRKQENGDYSGNQDRCN